MRRDDEHEQEEDERTDVAPRMDHVRLRIRGCRQPMVDLATRRADDQTCSKRAEVTRGGASGRRRAVG